MRRVALLAVAACLVVACLSFVSAQPTPVQPSTPFPYQWETRWYQTFIDNLSFRNSGATFPLRYLINQQWYKPGGPIFFYTGNEGPIDLFANNTGWMWDRAPEFNAMLVFAEHRYYGESLPFGSNSFTEENYVHLSAEQALADYAQLLTSLKFNMSIPDAKIIAFGGSYGGMLAAWFRRDYPHIVAGALAASAPIWWFNTLTSEFDDGAYSRIASNDFKAVSQDCFDGIAESWDSMLAYADANGFHALERELNLCPGTIITRDNITNAVFTWVGGAYSTLPMGDYPEPASFLGSLPAFPVNAACAFWPKMTTAAERVRATYQTMNLFLNYTGEYPTQCFQLSTTISTLGAGTQWDYQSCAEMVMPIGQYGNKDPKRPGNDLFYPQPWNLDWVIGNCTVQYGVTPRPTWITTKFGGPNDWKDVTNIVFSNGNLDPWRAGGVLTNQSATVVAIEVNPGAHHFDLRASSPLDPPSVARVRELEAQWVRQFIAQPTPSTIEYVYVDVPAVEPAGSDGMKPGVAAIIGVFSTLGVCLLLFACYYRYVNRRAHKSLVDVEGGRTASYNTM